MPAVPKKRTSRARQGERRSHLHLTVSQLVSCSNCQQPMRRHHVCPTCGYYAGQLVVEQKVKAEQSE